MNKLKLQSRLTAFKVGFAMAVLALVSIGGYIVNAYSNDGNAPATVIENASNITINQAQPVKDEPVFGAALDYASSDSFNLNGYQTYILKGYLGNGAGSNYATNTFAFTNPFRAATSTSGDVVVDQVNAAFGYTTPTSTVTLVELRGVATTTDFAFDCSSAASKYVTSTTAIIHSEAGIGASNRFLVRSDMTSSTNAGGGSAVYASNGELAGIKPLVTHIVLTPSKPYLVCKVWSVGGNSLSSFTDTAGSANVQITARIERGL